MRHPHPITRFARRTTFFVLLALNVACAPVVAMAAEAHEALHTAQGDVHGSLHAHAHDSPEPVGATPDAGDREAPLEDPLHAIAHIGHCCGLLSAITATAPGIVEPLLSHAAAASSDHDRAQQHPSPLLRPPKD